jgi:hypothetical protein
MCTGCDVSKAILEADLWNPQFGYVVVSELVCSQYRLKPGMFLFLRKEDKVGFSSYCVDEGQEFVLRCRVCPYQDVHVVVYGTSM